MKRIQCLHGFLGAPDEWTALLQQVPGRAYDVLEWCEAADDWPSVTEVAACALGQEEPSILLGYSFGGRLAQHLFARDPYRYAALVLVSAHPGLQYEDEKQARRASDAGFAQRFRVEPWAQVMDAWNAQPVLRGSAPRLTDARRRYAWADMLERYSLGVQEDFRPVLREHAARVFWMCGANDAKYVALGQALAQDGTLQHLLVVDNAGHRVPWDAPEAFAAQVRAVVELA